jgi:hypothetical protein
VFRVEPEPDERNIGLLPRGCLPYFLDVGLAGDHLVPESGHDLREQLEPVAPFVRDQNT